MNNVMIAGAGKIGSLIAGMLMESGDYQIVMVDKQFENPDLVRLQKHFSQLKTVVMDVENIAGMGKIAKDQNVTAVISSLPYFHNIPVARLAKEYNLHYFDLTEDVEVTKTVSELAKGAPVAFVPQCGLAPGFINIAAHSLMRHFDELEKVGLKVGALPQYPNNSLDYALTWSTDGLINEYGNLCRAIENGKIVTLAPLHGLEHVQIDGMCYEAFNTSGGLGSLADTYEGKVKNLTYKTIRYPGHCKKMQLLMNDLRLNEDRDTLKRILERAIPKTYQDLVLIAVSAIGYKNKQLIEEIYVKKVYPQKIADLHWSAIQVTTASGMCVVVDSVLKNPEKYRGLVLQEQFTLDDVWANRFGKCYK